MISYMSKVEWSILKQTCVRLFTNKTVKRNKLSNTWSTVHWIPNSMYSQSMVNLPNASICWGTWCVDVLITQWCCDDDVDNVDVLITRSVCVHPMCFHQSKTMFSTWLILLLFLFLLDHLQAKDQAECHQLKSVTEWYYDLFNLSDLFDGSMASRWVSIEEWCV